MNRILGPFRVENCLQRSANSCLTGMLCIILSICAGCGGGHHTIDNFPFLSLLVNAITFVAVQGGPANSELAPVQVMNLGGGTLNFTAVSEIGRAHV